MQPTARDVKRRGGRPKIDAPSPVDVHVGARVRLRRTLMGMSQEKLGSAVGLTFQQIQKYERGANRIGASRLFEMSRVLEVPVQFFFDDMHTEPESSDYKPMSGEIEADPKAPEQDPLGRRETLELVRAYYRIPDAQVRRRLFELAKALAAGTA
ncbi:MAG TPA: helix-turn-helix transcriptional regulator [Alphaproteobacteria bacterium]|jgi:transcriptional regulator with XRE-family HTH domain|nr:helix-turn-helix transcriptional regulator [Alphaproteobacteria bacterium]